MLLLGAYGGLLKQFLMKFLLLWCCFFFFIPREVLRVGVFFILNSFNLKIFLFTPLALIWLICCVAETNRTPFDFSEGESELVSGFNIEYGSVGFAMIFIAEYARIFFISVLFRCMFLSARRFNFFSIRVSSLLVFIWVWVRCTLPRYRYDILINLNWFSFLPISLSIIFYVLRVL